MRVIEHLKEIGENQFLATIVCDGKHVKKEFSQADKALKWLAECGYRLRHYHDDYVTMLEHFELNINCKGLEGVPREQILQYALLAYEPHLNYSRHSEKLRTRIDRFFRQ